MTTEQRIQLNLYIQAHSDADAAELRGLAGQLRGYLLELDIDSAEHASAGPAPPGTRAGEILLAGALTVILAQSPGLLNALVQVVQLWVSRSSDRSVTLKLGEDELKVNGLTSADQRKLIQSWIDRHTDR